MAVKALFKKIQVELFWRRPPEEYSEERLESLDIRAQKFYWQQHARYWKESSHRHAKTVVITSSVLVLYAAYNILMKLLWP